jgi:hypothetical protein
MLVRWSLPLASLAVCVAVVGCGETQSQPSEAMLKSIIGPRGGTALPLPDGTGYLEPILERPGAGKAKTAKVVLAVYFVGGDGKSPLASLPTSVTASLTLPTQAEPVTVSLSPKPQGNEPAARGRFATEPGDFDFDELRGELHITRDGQESTVPFAFR